jgi:signal transduction histidine kinase/ActR/RegA family two-component response regulator
VPVRFRARHPDYRADFYRSPNARAMGGGRELFGLKKDGSEVPIEIGLNPIETDEGLFVLSSIVDISTRVTAEQERARLEEQLRQSQKMEAVGTLAGGIAHDFNNILGGILGYAELALASAQDPGQRADLDEIVRAASRGRDLVSAILRFSRRQESVRRPIDLAQVVGESLRLLRPTLPSTIELEPKLTLSTPRVLADATAVQQVVMNLATNAAHAMKRGGRMEIAIESFYAKDTWARSRPGVHEGQYIVLRVQDTGQGMSSEVRSRALEPFFTTKETGGGSGLGLAMVHGIMREHDGIVELESEPGVGTTVRCMFPAIADVSFVGATHEDQVPRGRGERILFLDDEPALSRLGERRLAALGYVVTAMTEPTQALEAMAVETFDLLITDFTMPRMTGLELVQNLREAGYGLPVILLSGVATELPIEELDPHTSRVLTKPVGIHELAVAVRESLDQSPSAARLTAHVPREK